MATSVSNTSSTSAPNLSSAQTSPQEQTDRFLKLLVAQLNNQDPMNPMDNAQMTSQIAQINTVSGIQELNATMKSMASMQILQGASMVGHEVLTEGNAMFVNGGVGKGYMELAGKADKVTVQVKTPGGQVLDTIQLGIKEDGRHSFDWNASGYTGTAKPVFDVKATLGGKPVDVTLLARSSIDSVSTGAGGMNLTLRSGATVAYNAIRVIF